MSGQTATLLILSLLASLISASCDPGNDSRGGRSAPSQTSFALGREDAPVTAKQAEAPACPPPVASAPPLGPIVGPSCPAGHPPAGAELASAIEGKAADLAPGLSPLGPPRGSPFGTASLQGPPHCYVVIALCESGSCAVRIAPRSSPASIDAPGPAARFCPPATGAYDVTLVPAAGAGSCAARIYGD